MSCKYCEPWRIFMREKHSPSADIIKAGIFASEDKNTCITIETWLYDDMMAAELVVESWTVFGRVITQARIDYCPWCGEELKAVEW